MAERYCQLCSCTGAAAEGMPKGLDENWACPVMGGKKICLVCCHYDLEGGLGAKDTLLEICDISKKSPIQVHEACVACPHGGKNLTKPSGLISVMGDDGKQKTSGPEFRKAVLENKEFHANKIEWLKAVTTEELRASLQEKRKGRKKT